MKRAIPISYRRPRESAGVSGENSTAEQQGNRPNNFVLAGLVPAIHAFEGPKQRRGYADQVRARRLGGDVSVDNPLLLQEKFPRTALRFRGNDGQRIDLSEFISGRALSSAPLS
jgi:hypothetical protein